MPRAATFVRIATLFALLGVGAAVPGQGRAEVGPPTLVFVTKSDACECQHNLCVAGEQEVVNFLAGNPWGFRLDKVDLKATPKAAKELGVLAVPVVLLLDGQGTRVARFDGFFAAADLRRAWEAHRSGGPK
ncbi:MAG: hypothetical protein ACYDA8_01490 [Deferrisomatales bacterium]